MRDARRQAGDHVAARFAHEFAKSMNNNNHIIEEAKAVAIPVNWFKTPSYQIHIRKIYTPRNLPSYIPSPNPRSGEGARESWRKLNYRPASRTWPVRPPVFGLEEIAEWIPLGRR